VGVNNEWGEDELDDAIESVGECMTLMKIAYEKLMVISRKHKRIESLHMTLKKVGEAKLYASMVDQDLKDIE